MTVPGLALGLWPLSEVFRFLISGYELLSVPKT